MIVPWTEITSLASPSFYYSYLDKRNAKKTGKLPEKIGSFQIFMKGYKDAVEFLKEAQEHSTSGGLTREVETEFQSDFEKLVVLDYIMRNTGIAVI
jgi:phosphatidylinositol 4-kinase type 2